MNKVWSTGINWADVRIIEFKGNKVGTSQIMREFSVVGFHWVTLGEVERG